MSKQVNRYYHCLPKADARREKQASKTLRDTCIANAAMPLGTVTYSFRCDNTPEEKIAMLERRIAAIERQQSKGEEYEAITAVFVPQVIAIPTRAIIEAKIETLEAESVALHNKPRPATKVVAAVSSAALLGDKYSRFITRQRDPNAVNPYNQGGQLSDAHYANY
jgi:hypothetical protein